MTLYSMFLTYNGYRTKAGPTNTKMMLQMTRFAVGHHRAIVDQY
jgi:hypothetical protein